MATPPAQPAPSDHWGRVGEYAPHCPPCAKAHAPLRMGDGEEPTAAMCSGRAPSGARACGVRARSLNWPRPRQQQQQQRRKRAAVLQKGRAEQRRAGVAHHVVRGRGRSPGRWLGRWRPRARASHPATRGRQLNHRHLFRRRERGGRGRARGAHRRSRDRGGVCAAHAQLRNHGRRRVRRPAAPEQLRAARHPAPRVSRGGRGGDRARKRRASARCGPTGPTSTSTTTARAP